MGGVGAQPSLGILSTTSVGGLEDSLWKPSFLETQLEKSYARPSPSDLPLLTLASSLIIKDQHVFKGWYTNIHNMGTNSSSMSYCPCTLHSNVATFYLRIRTLKMNIK